MISREQLIQLIKDEQKTANWWKFKSEHAVWVPDGKGGSRDTDREYANCMIRIGLLNKLLALCK